MYNLVSNQPKIKNFKDFISLQTGRVACRVLGAITPERQASCPREFNLDAHVFSDRFASTHYGIMIPDLPEPFRYLSCASVIGDIGTSVTHTPSSISPYPAYDTVSLVHGTAISHPDEAFRVYSIDQDLQFNQEPFQVEFSNQTKLFEFENAYYLKTSQPQFEVDLKLTPTPAISWFSHSRFYEHYSVLMKYEGVIKQHEHVEPVSGLCTLEHWKATSVHKLLRGHAWADFKLPLNLFSYQVINLDHEQQLVLAFIGFAGQPAYTSVSYRHINGTSIQYDGDIKFDVIAYKTDPLITPDGHLMEVPQAMSWVVYHENKKVLDLVAVVDTPYCYGLASGYVSAYQWTGTFEGENMKGRGYLEYIDRR